MYKMFVHVNGISNKLKRNADQQKFVFQTKINATTFIAKHNCDNCNC